MLDAELFNTLEGKARAIRRHIVAMIGRAGSGHPGGSLSAADIVAALYFHEMRLDPTQPDWPERDRFILSKGHAAPVLYAALAERGYFPISELQGLRRLGCMLQGHPDCKRTPGVEISTGSLGQGLSVGVGMALAGKMDQKSYRVHVLLGDGENEEGQVWEAAMAGAHYRLENLTAVLDHNGLQIDGPIKEVMSPEPLADKWRAFGWHIICIDGHDFRQIIDAFREARETKGKPTIIIAETVKGKGVSFMENKAGWHGTAPKPEELEQALRELI
ncbi:MAG: transketolase [Bacillota bacterium]